MTCGTFLKSELDAYAGVLTNDRHGRIGQLKIRWSLRSHQYPSDTCVVCH